MPLGWALSLTDRSLQSTPQSHRARPFELTQDCVTAYEALSFRLDGQGTIVLDMGDEILDAQATLDFVSGRLPVIVFDGGSHRFDHMTELIEGRPDLFHTR
jgi:uncharacterized protein